MSFRYMELMPRRDMTVVAVNQQIAERFRSRGFRDVHVYYGVTRADVFFPRTDSRPADEPVHFAVIGNLDNPWKGAELTLAAFRALPADLRARGRLHLRNAKYAEDDAEIEAGCDCPACRGGFSRAYLRHLFMAGEMLGPTLLSVHNIRHFQRLLLDIRRAIREDDWSLLLGSWPVLGSDGIDPPAEDANNRPST